MQDHITVLTTGGTIDKVYFDANSAFEVGGSVVAEILKQAHVAAPINIVELMRKDSLELDDDDRQQILSAVRTADTERIVITHGTDTMTDTADVLGSVEDKVVVLTGSFAPARFAMTDAIFNIGLAFGAVQSLEHGVYIAMNGHIFMANQVLKNRETQRFELRDTL
ncbi:MAG: L-asparaginase [Candidatus Azotimanducaceae bacterium]|jgi:L-asparaginase